MQISEITRLFREKAAELQKFFEITPRPDVVYEDSFRFARALEAAADLLEEELNLVKKQSYRNTIRRINASSSDRMARQKNFCRNSDSKGAICKMMMPILKVVELLEKQSEATEEICGIQFVQTCRDAARYLVEQGERIVDLEQELDFVKREREYFRSRANFFGEVAGVLDKVISVEGYKAFRGTMRITPKAAVPEFELSGDWLYKPDTGCWYGKGSSFSADICTIMEVDA